MTFSSWTFSLCETISRLLLADRVEFSDLTPGYFGSVYVNGSADIASVGFAETCGCGIYRSQLDGRMAFSFPFGGGDKSAVLRALAEHCRESSQPLRFYPVGESEIACLRETLGGEWRIVGRPETDDYVYLAERLVSLEGLRVQRRAIRKFEARGPWLARDAVREDIPSMLGILEAWTAARGGPDGADHDICRYVVQGLGYAGTLATVVEQNGRPVAFEIGRRLNADMLVAEFEKCDPQVNGGCQIANREFVRRWAVSSAFVNRSCDLGNPGLAMAKRLYRPYRMVRKFVAEKVS